MTHQPQKEPVVEILTIGREILDGRVVDTNSVEIALALQGAGLIPRYAQKVDDVPARMKEAFRIAASRSDFVLVTGGLGPTSDDLTAEIFAEFMGVPFEEIPEALAVLKRQLDLIARPLTETQRKQAKLPRGSLVLDNPLGTAPGFGARAKIDGHESQWFFMPGVPREMRPMLKERILPHLPTRTGYRSRQWATHFVPEATLQERLKEVETRLPKGFEITYRTRFPENHIGLHGDCSEPARAKEFEKLCAEVEVILGADTFSRGEGRLPLLEEEVVGQLLSRGAQVYFVESCTGGLLSHRFTEVSGASRAYLGSQVVYDNAAKVEIGVPFELLAKHGAVSRETAVSLAERGLERLKKLVATRNATEAKMNPAAAIEASAPLYCISTTGIAGPTGGTPEKPVGLCYIALARSNGPTVFEEIRGRSSLERNLLKHFFAQKAFDLLRRNS